MPRGAERAVRLAAVLEVVYLIFNEGYAATVGEDLIRPALCAEAQRLGRILAGLTPDEPEVFGLLALMELQASRLAARTAPDGSLVPLPEQNRARWDQLLIRRGLAALARAEALGGADGPYALQAALAACHAGRAGRRTRTGRGSRRSTTACGEVLPSPVIELNRAVAHSMAFGPDAGLALLDAIAQARRCATTRLCRRPGAIFCSGPAGGTEAKLVRARGRPHPQRARKGLPAATGGGLRQLTADLLAYLDSLE